MDTHRLGMTRSTRLRPLGFCPAQLSHDHLGMKLPIGRAHDGFARSLQHRAVPLFILRRSGFARVLAWLALLIRNTSTSFYP